MALNFDAESQGAGREGREQWEAGDLEASLHLGSIKDGDRRVIGALSISGSVQARSLLEYIKPTSFPQEAMESLVVNFHNISGSPSETEHQILLAGGDLDPGLVTRGLGLRSLCPHLTLASF